MQQRIAPLSTTRLLGPPRSRSRWNIPICCHGAPLSTNPGPPGTTVLIKQSELAKSIPVPPTTRCRDVHWFDISVVRRTGLENNTRRIKILEEMAQSIFTRNGSLNSRHPATKTFPVRFPCRPHPRGKLGCRRARRSRSIVQGFDLPKRGSRPLGMSRDRCRLPARQSQCRSGSGTGHRTKWKPGGRDRGCSHRLLAP